MNLIQNREVSFRHLQEFQNILIGLNYKSRTISETMMIIKKYLIYIEEFNENEVSYDTVNRFLNHFYNDCTITRYRFVKSSCFKYIGFVFKNNIFWIEKTIHDYPWSKNDNEIIQKFRNEIELINSEITVKRKILSIQSLCISLAKVQTNILDSHLKDILFHLKDKNCEDYRYIKQFLSWSFKNKFLPVDFSYFIHIPKRPVRIPTTYSEQEISQLINSLDKNKSSFYRDQAILFILAFTGIRACDITQLCYDNFDFEKHELNLIQKKTGVPLQLKLPLQVLDSVKTYNLHRPVTSQKELFLRINAPFLPISSSIVRHIVSSSYQKAGIDTHNKKHGSHSLRSSLASAMVNQGTDYEIVRKTLGHTSTDSLNRYIQIDIEKLRMCSLPTIEASGNFMKWLKKIQ